MVDVSAQASCTITPINPITLTAAGVVLPDGTENVMIRCNCSEDDGSEINTVRWYKPDGNLVSRMGLVVLLLELLILQDLMVKEIIEILH